MERCWAIHTGDNLKPEVVRVVVSKLTAEVWSARTVTSHGTERERRCIEQGWGKHAYGVIKVNCDASWEALTRRGGTDVIIRDSTGKIVGGRNTFSKDTSAKNIDVKSIKQAVELAKYHKWEDVIMESGVKNII